MEEVFCMACGQKIAATAQFCPHCGAQQAGVAAPAASVAPAAPPSSPPAPAAAAAPLPEGVKGWSWGGFWLNWLWAAFNKVWIGLLALIPLVNLVMMVVLGLKGREWAWQKGSWRDVEHFRQVQKKWDIAAWIVMALSLVLGLALGFMEARMKSGGLADRSAPVAEEKTAESQPPALLPALSQAEAEKKLAAMLEKGGNLTLQAEAEGEAEGEWEPPEGLSLPTLRFSRAELFNAMGKAGFASAEQAPVRMYLNDPDAFMQRCVADLAAQAHALGASTPSEVHQLAEESCQGKIAVYHACLDQTPLREAIVCLKKNS